MAKINLLTSGIRGVFHNPVIGSVTTQQVEPDRGFKECCYVNYAFGDLIGDTSVPDNIKNDIYGGHIFKREEVSDTITYTLIKNGGDVPFSTSHGEIFNFGDFSNPDISGIKVEWKKVLQAEGEGNYQLKAELNYSSGNSTVLSNTFVLKQWSWFLSNETVRFETTHNECYDLLDIDLTGINWSDHTRVRGFFGRRETTWEQTEWLDGFLNQRQTQIESIDNYTFKSGLLPKCISYRLLDWTFLSHDIKVTDYNQNNHDYDLINFPIFPNKVNKPEYWRESRKGSFEFVFTRKKKNNRSYNCE